MFSVTGRITPDHKKIYSNLGFDSFLDNAHLLILLKWSISDDYGNS